MPDRRRFLAAGAACALTTATPTIALAANTFKVGAIGATVLSDGHMTVGLGRLSGGDPSETRKAASISGDALAFALNVTLLNIAGKRILIDAGAGGLWDASAGRLADAMNASGIDPRTIDQVVLTHAHPDHLWGLVDDFDDSLRFPNAIVTIPDAEFLFWMSAGTAERAGIDAGRILGARRVLNRIAHRLTRHAPDSEPSPGISYIAAHGHTPGQCAVLATSGSEHLLMTADTIFHPVVSVAHPDWRPVQDMDGDEAVASRKRMLDIAATRQALVVAYHVATPGAGHIERSGAGYTWRGA